MKGRRPGLSLSEARVARLIAEGRTDEEIADHLGVTAAEVDADRVGLYRKLGVQSRTELALLIPSTVSEWANNPQGPGGVLEPLSEGQPEGSTTP
jgi:DNA-binding CsgD family transcriptional regulator